MGRIVKIVKTLYGKINWGYIKNVLLSILKMKIIIKENGAIIKIDKKFINEYLYSNYSFNINKKLKNIKGNLALHIVEIVENSGHIIEEDNIKTKHQIDANRGFEKYKCRFFMIDENTGINTEYSCIIVVRCPNFKEKYLYDIVDIKRTSTPQRWNM